MLNSERDQELREDYWAAIELLGKLPGSAVDSSRNLRIIDFMRKIYVRTQHLRMGTETEDQAAPLRVIR
jgi:hypothetical protein